MTTNTATSPTDPQYYANHSDDALRAIVARFSQTANAMVGTSLGIEALGIEFAARAQLIIRGATV